MCYIIYSHFAIDLAWVFYYVTHIAHANPLAKIPSMRMSTIFIHKTSRCTSGSGGGDGGGAFRECNIIGLDGLEWKWINRAHGLWQEHFCVRLSILLFSSFRFSHYRERSFQKRIPNESKIPREAEGRTAKFIMLSKHALAIHCHVFYIIFTVIMWTFFKKKEKKGEYEQI